MKTKEEYQKSVNIGFDIGIASVGWSVLDTESGHILESGVSIFPSGSAEKNAERRTFRQSRRLTRRRRNRIQDLKKLLEKNGFSYPEKIPESNPYEIRVAGLSEKLTKDELAYALVHLVKRRGISYSLADSEEESANTSSYKQSIAINQQLLESKTPAEIQLERLQQYGKIRGQVKSGENILLNIFPNSAYVQEAQQLLENQARFYPMITPSFIEEIIELISRKRPYYVGPGSEKSRTDYGIYRTNGDTLDNLFEILIGKDKIFPDQYRAAGNSYSAQLFNLLNDLNNLKIDSTEDGKLTTDQKELIIQELRTTTAKVDMIKLISKITETASEKITGYRVSTSNKPQIHSLKIYRAVRKFFLSEGIEINDWPCGFLDELGHILTLNTENGEIRKSLQKLVSTYSFVTHDLIDLIIQNKKLFSIESNKKWHSFSLKTLNLLIPELLHSSKEQMTILTELGMLHEQKRDYVQKNNINIKELTEEIYNPVVRKSVRKAMEIFNALYRKYPKIAYIVIEMPRNANEEEARKKIQAFQKDNRSEKEDALAYFQELAGVSDVQLESQLYQRKKLRQKIRFWYQQQEKCPYSGKTIPARELFSHDHLFEIDHIIPLSISYDDGLNNKVLCYGEMNQEKGQRTPYEFLRNRNEHSFANLQAMLKQNKRMNDAKKTNLLFTENIRDIEVRKRFIARNLVDTRYASRVVLNELQQFMRSKDADTKISVIRGKMTSKLREQWHLNKSRETYHHHAVDATVIAAFPMLTLWERNAEYIPLKVNENTIDLKTGEILSDDLYKKELYELPYARFLEQIPKMTEQIKFSHQVDKKMNRKVSDATIYATRSAKVGKDKVEEDYVLGKIKDIYAVEDYKKFRKIYDKDKTRFLMYRIDPKTFEKLEDILFKYPATIDKVESNNNVKKIAISPFELYRQENGPITKYSKKENGPIIKTLKYYDSKLGNAIDITPKDAKNKKVVLQSLKPWRTDIYFNHKKQEYEIMGLKYADLQFYQGEYGILDSKYQEIKTKESVSEISEFLFSLYRGDRIRVYKSEEEWIELLFGSRTLPAKKGYVELKPIDRNKFDAKEVVLLYGEVSTNGQFIKKFLPKNYKLLKNNTDALGNTFYLQKESEKPQNIIDTAF